MYFCNEFGKEALKTMFDVDKLKYKGTGIVSPQESFRDWKFQVN